MVILGSFAQRHQAVAWAGVLLSALYFIVFTKKFLDILGDFTVDTGKLTSILLVWTMTLGTAIAFILLLRFVIKERAAGGSSDS